jgi:hypothetical protein
VLSVLSSRTTRGALYLYLYLYLIHEYHSLTYTRVYTHVRSHSHTRTQRHAPSRYTQYVHNLTTYDIVHTPGLYTNSYTQVQHTHCQAYIHQPNCSHIHTHTHTHTRSLSLLNSLSLSLALALVFSEFNGVAVLVDVLLLLCFLSHPALLHSTCASPSLLCDLALVRLPKSWPNLTKLGSRWMKSHPYSRRPREPIW